MEASFDGLRMCSQDSLAGLQLFVAVVFCDLRFTLVISAVHCYGIFGILSAILSVNSFQLFGKSHVTVRNFVRSL